MILSIISSCGDRSIVCKERSTNCNSHIAEVSTYVNWSVRMATLVVMVLHCSQENEVEYTTSIPTKLKRKLYI